ncbi:MULTISPECIES: GntR family transcriptional regulator [Pseudomonas]|jgi:DNA-binding transcriptional MocR family regulator|uniref:GntR family transcriptional regulator n=1 Tax=Pseudomonas TaxID=286 RepID=UPI0006427A35|nr:MULTISPECIES: PLP-dependent aminotransferase family protein [Pseudomonas]QXE10138.1 PLP-dependent aminotransferase family protein [Pseudomonas sp. AN-B15]
MRVVREPGFAYQAVYRYLMRLMAETAGDDNTRLPSLRQLAERLNVSISTIQYAYSLLEKEGRVYSVAKSGYYARASAGLSSPVIGNDLLETLYINTRRPGMRLLSAEDPVSVQSLDSPLLLLERELLRQYPRQSTLVDQPCGELELRGVVAARYTTSPQQCWHAEDVYIGADLRGVLEILVAVLKLKHATVLVESPCDWVILRLLQAAEVRVIELPLQACGGLEPQRLEALLNTEDVRLIVLSSGLCMPRGTQVPADNRSRIAGLLVKHGTWVLENDCYGELSEAMDGGCLRDLLDPERLMVFSTFEKFMGIEAPYGVVLSRQWKSELLRHFLMRSFRLSPIRQKAIARLYGNGRIDQHLHVLRRLLRERRAPMIHLLRERLSDALQVVEPQGGATVWVRAKRPVDMRDVFQRLLRQQVLIAPGELFSLQGLHRRHLRLNLLDQGETGLSGAIAMLGDALRLAAVE